MDAQKIEVIGMELIENGSPLKALVDLEVGSIVIKYIRLVQRAGQPLRISLPALKKGTPADWRWEPAIVITAQDLRRGIEKAILDEYRRKTGSR